MCNKWPTPQIGYRHDELYGNEVDPHKKWGEKHVSRLKKHTCKLKNLGPKVSKKPTWGSSWRRWANAENLLKEGNNDANRKVFGQNIKRGSQKQFKHPLILKAPLHV